MTYPKKRSTADKIKSSLWILISFSFYFTGLGLVYAGYKTDKKSWAYEGILYEIPWLIAITLPPYNKIGHIFVLFGILLTLISIIRSFRVNKKYQKILDSGNYKKSKDKLHSFGGIVFSAIPIFNGLPFIYFGKKAGKITWIIEGIIYELPFILRLITQNEMLTGLIMTSSLISIISFINLNYNNSYFYKEMRKGKMQTPKSTIKDKKHIITTIEKYEKSKTPSVYEKKEKTTAKTPSVYEKYEKQIRELKKNFDDRENKVVTIINKRFTDSNITHNRFMEVINKSHKNFYKQKRLAEELTEITPKYDSEIIKNIKEKISCLEKIIEKLDKLTLELITNIRSEEKLDKELELLLNDMEDLIKNVKNYY